jgi:uncharacterized damage-inducible protein DinB
MTVADLQRRFEYGWWANRKLFSVIAGLSVDEFTRNVAGSYGSVRNTLVHILSAEWGWLERSGGTARGKALDALDYPTLQSVVDTWGKVEQHLRAFLARTTDADLERVMGFELPKGKPQAMRVREMLEQGANHGVHHRGQVALLLRMIGQPPGNFDLVVYDAERRAAGAP